MGRRGGVAGGQDALGGSTPSTTPKNHIHNSDQGASDKQEGCQTSRGRGEIGGPTLSQLSHRNTMLLLSAYLSVCLYKGLTACIVELYLNSKRQNRFTTRALCITLSISDSGLRPQHLQWTTRHRLLTLLG